MHVEKKEKTVTCTCTLPTLTMEEIAEYALEKKISKNEVIEMAIRNFFDAEIKRRLERGFKLAAEDPEITEMAEWGLGDYLEQLKELEK